MSLTTTPRTVARPGPGTPRRLPIGGVVAGSLLTGAAAALTAVLVPAAGAAEPVVIGAASAQAIRDVVAAVRAGTRLRP